MLQVGSVVYSTAGRDKHRFYAVVSLEPGAARIADGKTRKLICPKRKNHMHLRPTKTVLDSAAMKTDKALRLALAPLNGEGAWAQQEGGMKLV